MSWTRRQFLRGAGVSLALPTLESLLGKLAHAQSAPSSYRRLISLQMPHGGSGLTTWTGPYTPSVAAGWTERLLPYTGSNGSPRQHRYYLNSITQLAASQGGSLCHSFPSSFAPFYSKMNLLRGIDVATYLGHHSGSVQMGNQWDCDQGRGLGLPLTPMATIDQLIAYHSQAAPSVRRIVNVGSSRMSSGYTNPFSRSGSFVRGVSTTVPMSLFRQVFATPVTDPRSRTVVDRVFTDYQNLRNNPKLSGQDRLKLEAHVEYVQDLSNRIVAFSSDPAVVAATTNLGNQVNALPTRNGHLGAARGAEPTGFAEDQMLPASTLRAHYECLIDVLVVALRTQHTRVVNFAFDELNRAYDWHEYAHDFRENALAQNYRWLHESVLLRLLAGMNDTNYMEAGRTVLDNSLVYYMQEHNEVHQLYSIPTVLFGSLGGVLRTNQYIDYRDQNIQSPSGPSLPGMLVNQLYVSILKGMGLQPADYERRIGGIPIPGYGDALDYAANTSGYFQARNCYRYSFAHLAEALPDLFAA
jgi:hypothetical protein